MKVIRHGEHQIFTSLLGSNPSESHLFHSQRNKNIEIRLDEMNFQISKFHKIW